MHSYEWKNSSPTDVIHKTLFCSWISWRILFQAIKLDQSIAEYIATKKIDNGLKTAVRIAKENRDIETRCMKLSLDLQNHFEHMFQEYNNR